MKKLLLVEDETAVRETLAQYLRTNGLTVLTAETLAVAEHALDTTVELIILDWNLPDGEGLDWLKTIRARGSRIPVIFLTARAEVIDKVLGLESGASDYLTKPFEPRELLARIRVHLKRPIESEEAKETGDAVLDASQACLRVHGTPIALSPLELKFLQAMMASPNKIFSRSELYDRVWGYDFNPDGRAVDHLVAQLRSKIPIELIETVRGHGYRIVSRRL